MLGHQYGRTLLQFVAACAVIAGLAELLAGTFNPGLLAGGAVVFALAFGPMPVPDTTGHVVWGVLGLTAVGNLLLLAPDPGSHVAGGVILVLLVWVALMNGEPVSAPLRE